MAPNWSGLSTSRTPRVALVEPTQHALNKEVRCKLCVNAGIPNLWQVWWDWETEASEEPGVLYDVSRGERAHK